MNHDGYERDVFYDGDHLSVDDQVSLFEDAKEICTDWRVDELDCSKSWCRNTIEMGWDDAIQAFRDAKVSRYFSFIYRRGYSELPYQLEVGYRVCNNVHDRDLFLWIYVPADEIEPLVTKYGLELIG